MALDELCRAAERGDIALPAPGGFINLHAHTFFSYNAYGYSPSKFAWLARKKGLYAAGIVDFDILDGLDEFYGACRKLGLRCVGSLESRVFVPEFAALEINSPGEPGIAYHMGVGFPSRLSHPLLSRMRKTADQRNRDLIGRVNAFTAPVELDFERDVLSLTPSGNATERHMCLAYAERGDHAFWDKKLGGAPADPAALQAKIRSVTMKRGGVGYVQPGADTFPELSEMNRFVLEAGGIPTITWLDGTSGGEKRMEELVDIAMSTGAAALNIIPDRNYRPGVLDEKLKNLNEVVALAERRGLPVVVGTEMNAPGNKFVDDFDSQELRPLLPVFIKGAHIVCAHTALSRVSGVGYVGTWAEQKFGSTAEKNEFFEELGKRLTPGREEALRGAGERSPESFLRALDK